MNDGDAYDLVNEYRVLNEDPDLDAYLANPKAFRRQSMLIVIVLRTLPNTRMHVRVGPRRP